MRTILSSRRDHQLTKFFVFLLMAALIAGMAGCDGDGYAPPPTPSLEIRTWYDLDAVRGDLTGRYILMNDLDSTIAGYDELASPIANQGKGWEPIGHGNWVWTWFGVKLAGEVFKGTLDGQGYAIRDLYINRQEEDQVGLFGIVAAGGIITEGGIIKNVTLINANVTTGEANGEPLGLNEDTLRALDVAPVWGIGGLVGYNGGTVSNCHGTGNVSSDSGIGGLVGHNGGIVSNCSFTGSVSGNEGVGGLVRQNDGTVRNCYFVGNVTGNRGVGGLVGWNHGTISNSYSTGSVTGSESVGGLVGGNADTVNNSFWDTQTSGQAHSDGGTGKITAEMKDITTFSGVGWNIIAVALNETNPAYIWNIVDDETYPFLSWEA